VIVLDLMPDFTWNTKMHGNSLGFWLWMEDPDEDMIIHKEYYTLHKKSYDESCGIYTYFLLSFLSLFRT